MMVRVCVSSHAKTYKAWHGEHIMSFFGTPVWGMTDGQLETRGGGAAAYVANRLWPVVVAESHHLLKPVDIKYELMVIQYGSQRGKPIFISTQIYNHYGQDGDQVVLAYASHERGESWMNAIGYGDRVVDKECLLEALRRMIARQQPAWLDVTFYEQNTFEINYWREVGFTPIGDGNFFFKDETQYETRDAAVLSSFGGFGESAEERVRRVLQAEAAEHRQKVSLRQPPKRPAEDEKMQTTKRVHQ